LIAAWAACRCPLAPVLGTGCPVRRAGPSAEWLVSRGVCRRPNPILKRFPLHRRHASSARGDRCRDLSLTGQGRPFYLSYSAGNDPLILNVRYLEYEMIPPEGAVPDIAYKDHNVPKVSTLTTCHTLNCVAMMADQKTKASWSPGKEEVMAMSMVNISTTARELEVHPNTVRNWIKHGLIAATRLPSGIHRVPRTELERLKKEFHVPRSFPDDVMRPAPRKQLDQTDQMVSTHPSF